MHMYELFMVAVSLSMDAFAVSVCKGLSAARLRPEHSLICGGWFGGFQALMPLTGWLLGMRFRGAIVAVDHWVAFLLLGVIGLSMVREAKSGGAEALDSSFSPRAMLPLAVATSVDALAVGITFAFLRVEILPAALLIGASAFLLSAVGVRVGFAFGGRFKSRAELAGGLILLGMGTKILLEHTLLA